MGNNLGWKSVFTDHNKGRTKPPRSVKDKVTACRICGKPTTGGHICQSCKAFIDRMRAQEAPETILTGQRHKTIKKPQKRHTGQNKRPERKATTWT